MLIQSLSFFRRLGISNFIRLNLSKYLSTYHSRINLGVLVANLVYLSALYISVIKKTGFNFDSSNFEAQFINVISIAKSL